jgi:hypothetical protein
MIQATGQIVDQTTPLLKLLMDQAEQASGGALVNVIAYKGDHVAAQEEIKVIDETRRAKKCDGR